MRVCDCVYACVCILYGCVCVRTWVFASSMSLIDTPMLYVRVKVVSRSDIVSVSISIHSIKTLQQI